MREALELAWDRAVASREVAGERGRIEAEFDIANRSWATPPALFLGLRDARLAGSSGKRESEIGISLPLRLPGQRSAQVSAAEQGLTRTHALYQVLRLRLAGELRESAWTVAGLEAGLKLSDIRVQTLRVLAEDVDRRVHAGDLARADSLAAQAEYLAATVEHQDVGRQLASARARLTVLTGTHRSIDLTTPEIALEAEHGTLHPERQLAQQATEWARRKFELLRASRRGAPELILGARHDANTSASASQNTLSIGLRLPLVGEYRNVPLEAAALAELEVARTHEHRLDERLANESNIARQASLASRKQLESRMTQARLLHERAGLIEKSFRAGESPLPELLRAMDAAAQADTSVARQRVAMRLNAARLEQALGVMP